MYRRKFLLLLILPLAGLALGYGYAYAVFHGLLETWHLLGNPGEKIVRIVGVWGGNRALVETVGGEFYALAFAEGDEVAIPGTPAWEEEPVETVDPVMRLQYYGADFYLWPKPFQTVQEYQHEYIYHVEGKGEVRFALATDGNLWAWEHKISGLTGLIFYFYPAMGFLAGMGLAAGIALVMARKAGAATGVK